MPWAVLRIGSFAQAVIGVLDGRPAFSGAYLVGIGDVLGPRPCSFKLEPAAEPPLQFCRERMIVLCAAILA
jgi:hypothetical protein